MTTRRSLTLLIFVVALCIPATASGKASMQLMTKVVGGKYSNLVSATVKFPVPKKSTAAKACKGKITFSVPIGKKAVKKKKKTVYSVKKSSLKTVNGACVATADLNVPEALLGKTLKFKATFKGNAAVKKFTKSAKFLVKLPDQPVVPPTFNPTSGPWTIQQTPNIGSGNLIWSMTVGADGSVAKVDRFSGIPLTCSGGTQVFLLLNEAPFDTPFRISAANLTVSDEWTDPTAPLAKTTSTFVLHFDSQGHATGTFRVTGSVYYNTGAAATDTVYTGCDTGPINIDLAPGVFS